MAALAQVVLYINIIFIFIYKTVQAKAAILKCSVFEWSGPFQIRTFQNGRSKLGRFIQKENLFIFIKRPRLSMVRFSNGPDHSKTELSTIRIPNFETFGFRMGSEFECSVFEPPLYLIFSLSFMETQSLKITLSSAEINCIVK